MGFVLNKLSSLWPSVFCCCFVFLHKLCLCFFTLSFLFPRTLGAYWHAGLGSALWTSVPLCLMLSPPCGCSWTASWSRITGQCFWLNRATGQSHREMTMWFLSYDWTLSGISTHSLSQRTENILERPQGLDQPACHSPSFLAHNMLPFFRHLAKLAKLQLAGFPWPWLWNQQGFISVYLRVQCDWPTSHQVIFLWPDQPKIKWQKHDQWGFSVSIGGVPVKGTWVNRFLKLCLLQVSTKPPAHTRCQKSKTTVFIFSLRYSWGIKDLK